MRKALYYSIPIFLLAAFVLIMNAGGYLKKPMGSNDNVEYYIQRLSDDLHNSSWDSADKDIIKLDNAWAKVAARIQFSSERAEMDKIEINIVRIKEYIHARDKAGTMAELGELKDHWDDIGK